jgi:hypothetical protein
VGFLHAKREGLVGSGKCPLLQIFACRIFGRCASARVASIHTYVKLLYAFKIPNNNYNNYNDNDKYGQNRGQKKTVQRHTRHHTCEIEPHLRRLDGQQRLDVWSPRHLTLFYKIIEYNVRGQGTVFVPVYSGRAVGYPDRFRDGVVESGRSIES